MAGGGRSGRSPTQTERLSRRGSTRTTYGRGTISCGCCQTRRPICRCRPRLRSGPPGSRCRRSCSRRSSRGSSSGFVAVFRPDPTRCEAGRSCGGPSLTGAEPSVDVVRTHVVHRKSLTATSLTAHQMRFVRVIGSLARLQTNPGPQQFQLFRTGHVASRMDRRRRPATDDDLGSGAIPQLGDGLQIETPVINSLDDRGSRSHYR